ncbi:uncharacterized protein C16C10.8 [Episyrphus balteatus]|uniref:uncharacterized protein C16C10.8 n=1 Tax=Episyrphus balteatus TaxID=286459 RepID=UPI00248603DC|nr:uncharacterized protein C16C10.8 [Episyrphus balteatus]
MVFFTCNHCGESVKKPSVEKHYNFKCRGAPKNVSCMDCQKDFHGEDYVAHIKCISEAEKYSGKDYVPKESKNSGQKKQDNWMEIIRSILDTKEYNLSGQTRSTFQKLQSVDNVPRKKVKFINFAANCMRLRMDHIEEVWAILDKELEKMKAEKAAQVAAAKKELPKPVISPVVIERAPPKPEPKEKSIGDEVETMKVKKSKSKKRKIDKEIQNTIEQDEEAEILQMVKKEVEKDQVGATVEPSKKKSKKSSSSSDSVAKQAEANAEQEPTISTTTPDEFQWSLVILFTIKKYGNSMKLDKLKRKIQKMYLTKREWTAFNEKQQMKFDKKFAKHVKKCNLKIENNVVRVE